MADAAVASDDAKDWVHNFLTTTKYREVDEPLYTAMQFVPGGDSLDSQYVRDVLLNIKTSQDLVVTRFMWLAILSITDSMHQHCIANGSPKAAEWLGLLPGMFSDFYSGSHHKFDNPMSAFMDDVLRAYL
jgi:hypothetical protein